MGWGKTNACAPSLRAMNGRSDQPCSAAGSKPSSTPNQRSTSGPLAWWKPTTVTSGMKPTLEGDSGSRDEGVGGTEGVSGAEAGGSSSGTSVIWAPSPASDPGSLMVGAVCRRNHCRAVGMGRDDSTGGP